MDSGNIHRFHVYSAIQSHIEQTSWDLSAGLSTWKLEDMLLHKVGTLDLLSIYLFGFAWPERGRIATFWSWLSSMMLWAFLAIIAGRSCVLSIIPFQVAALWATLAKRQIPSASHLQPPIILTRRKFLLGTEHFAEISQLLPTSNYRVCQNRCIFSNSCHGCFSRDRAFVLHHFNTQFYIRFSRSLQCYCFVPTLTTFLVTFNYWNSPA